VSTGQEVKGDGRQKWPEIRGRGRIEGCGRKTGSTGGNLSAFVGYAGITITNHIMKE